MAITPLMPVYPRSPVRPVRGEGVYLYGEQGEKYLDFAAGIAVNLLGHGHPHLTKAIQEQAATLMHVSNLYGSPQGEAFAQRLVDLTFADTVFFTNSGVEAVECAIKTARRYHYAKGNPAQARPDHLLQRLPRPDDGDDQRDRPGEDARRLRAAAAGLQGRRVRRSRRGAGGDRREYRRLPGRADPGRGRHPPGDARNSSPGLRAACDEHDLMLVFDEVQCGVARTGTLYAYEHYGVEPDIMASAKGIGGGFPMGACLATEKAAAGMVIGTHGSTYGGNPLAMAAGQAVFDVVANDEFLGQRPRRRASGCARRSSR